nr:MAG TPA: hypothetical protein [Caudoviricetes sp.]
MEPMYERIAEISKESGLNKTEFGQKIGISQSMASLICLGKANPSDRTISDICRVFRVNEDWLRNGTGEPYRKKPRAEELGEIFADLEVDETVKARFIRTLADFPEEYFVQALEMARKFLERYAQEEGPGA